jgi:hypothetical protein
MSFPVLGRAAAALVATATVLVGSAAPSTAAAPPASQSAGTFLSGNLAGTDLSTVAAIEGETAQSTGGRDVTRWNSLNVSALDGAVKLPLTNALALPGGNVVTLGAVQQYAQALANGGAHAASGAVSNSGGISVGGSDAPPANATIDLAGAGGASIAKTLGDVKLSTGALAARADQAAGAHGTQTGSYQIAGLALDLTAPALAALINPLITQGAGTVSKLATAFNGLGLPVQVTGIDKFPDVANALTSASADGGAITANLRTGSLHIDVAALLAAAGLNLNRLPANTHLAPYLAAALSSALPNAISSLIATQQAKFIAAFNGVGFSAGGVPLNASALSQATGILDGMRTTLTSALSAGASQLVGTVFAPLAVASEQLLDPIVNVQSVSGGTFTERAMQLLLGGGAVELNLASAAVGPSNLAATAPAPVTAAPSPGTTSKVQNVSTIKIDAGGGTSGGSPAPWIGLLLLLAGLSGLGWRRARARAE